MKYSHLKKNTKKTELFNDGKKLCVKCNQVKLLESFCDHKRTSDKKSSWCTTCSNKSMMDLRRKPDHAYERLRKIDHNTDITFEDFILLIKQPCYYCNGVNDTSGLDRLNPGSSDGGYMKKNVVSCCKTCNRMKNNLTLGGFLIAVNKIYHNRSKEEDLNNYQENCVDKITHF